MASEYEGYRCRVNAAEGRRYVVANEILLGLGQVRLG